MNPPGPDPAIVLKNNNESPPPSLRRMVRNSALFNAAIVLTSFPVLAFAGGAKVIFVTLEIMAAISVLIWASTFALFSLMSLPWMFQRPASTARRREAHDL